MGAMGILQVIYYCVYVCICKVYSSVFKSYAPHAFVYDSHFSQLDQSGCCSSIIDDKSYAPICILKEKDRKRKTALNNMLMGLFEGNFILGYAFKVPVNDFHNISSILID